MELFVFRGRLVEKQNQLWSEGLPLHFKSLGEKSWYVPEELNNWGFCFWLHKRFENEHIMRDHNWRRHIGKIAMIISATDDDEEYYSCDGELYRLYMDGKLDTLIEEYSQNNGL